MALGNDLRMYGRLGHGLRHLRHPITLEQARAFVRDQLAAREDNFLRLVERAVFGGSDGPYRALFAWAGCEEGDVRRLVRDEGLEGALRALREAGVYVTFEEQKGRAPIVRGGRELPVGVHDFDNPFVAAAYWRESGASTGAGTRIQQDVEHIRAWAHHEAVACHAYGVHGAPMAVWRGVLPDGAGIGQLLTAAFHGWIAERWFTPVLSRDLGPGLFKFRVATPALLQLARLQGVRLPRPERMGLDEAPRAARWLAQRLRSAERVVLQSVASRAHRICRAAQEEGLDLSGAWFHIAGEPITAAKVRPIGEVGARFYTSYGFAEAGRFGAGCPLAEEPNDVHLAAHVCAVIQHERIVAGGDATVPAFLVTSLLPTAPRILINAESDDYGELEERRCGCPLDELGLHTHLRDIRSFGKLTGEGMTLVGSDMVRVLEEVLPARFGGTAVDYQLVEAEEPDGITRLRLRVSPRVELCDEAEVVETVLRSLEAQSAMGRSATQVWRQARSLRVERREPIPTSRGKHLPLQVLRPDGPRGGAHP